VEVGALTQQVVMISNEFASGCVLFEFFSSYATAAYCARGAKSVIHDCLVTELLTALAEQVMQSVMFVRLFPLNF